MMKNVFSRPVLRGGVLVLAAASLTAVAPIEQAEARGRDNTGAAVAAGVAGLAIGAILGSASASSPRYYAAPPATAYYPAPTYSAPVYTAPSYTTTYTQPVYVQQPQPVYVQPQPVYVQQPVPVYVPQPVPVYSAPSPSISIGFGYSSGPRYYGPSRPHWGGGRDHWRGRDRWR